MFSGWASVMAVFLITALAYAANGADDPPTTTSTSIASAMPAGSRVAQVDVVGEDEPATHDINDDNGGQDDDDPATHDINDEPGVQVDDSVG